MFIFPVGKCETSINSLEGGLGNAMTRLALLLSIVCGALLVFIAYLSVTVIQQREELSCGSSPADVSHDCS